MVIADADFGSARVANLRARSAEWIYPMGSDRQSLAAIANVYGRTIDHAAGLPSPESFLVGNTVDQIFDRQACLILKSGVCPRTVAW